MMTKQKMTPWMTAAILILCGTLVLMGCHRMEDYEPTPPEPAPAPAPTPIPYPVTDEERVAYAEKVLGVTIDMQQDWVLSTEYSVTVNADATSATLSFRAPSVAEVLYAACLTADGKCVARPFLPGTETAVSFIDVPGAYDATATRSDGSGQGVAAPPAPRSSTLPPIRTSASRTSSACAMPSSRTCPTDRTTQAS